MMLPNRMYQSAFRVVRPIFCTLRQKQKRRCFSKSWMGQQPFPIVTSWGIHNFAYGTNRWFSSTSSSSSIGADDAVSDTRSNSSSKPNDAYHLFSLPLSFTIDEELLRTKYHRYMQLLHPDKKQTNESDNNSSGNATDEPTTVAAAITHAYNVLKRPHLRAMHLLKIMNRTSSKNTNNTSHANTDDDDDENQNLHLTDPTKDFLLQVMDLQELISELDTDEELKPYYDDNQQRINDTCQQLQIAYEKSDITEFKNCTTKLKYWTRIDETLRNKMTSLE